MRKIYLFFISLAFVFSAQAQSDAVAQQLVARYADSIGLTKNDLGNYIVSNSYYNETGGTQMVYINQSYKGLPVYNQIMVLAFKDGKLVSKSGSFLPNVDKLTNGASASPSVAPADAVRTSIADAKVGMPAIVTALNTLENGKKYDFGKLNIATENVTAELMWVPVDDGKNITAVKLAWQVQLYLDKKADYLHTRVDAATNTIVSKNNLTVFENFDQFRSGNTPNLVRAQGIAPQGTFTGPALSFGKPAAPLMMSPSLVATANYTVIPFPAESPIHAGGTAALRTNPWTLAGGNAVSLGWHNDGTADYVYSRGNNVYAQEDRDNNNNTFGIPANSTTTPDPLNFTYPINYNVAPTTADFQQFATTNLFYWNNLLHDLTYNYGFTEPAGNFQNNNQGRGGAQADYVIADAQDAGGTNNANMSTPADGGRPRMQMYLWDPVRSVTTLNVNAPGTIAGPYTAVEGSYSTANLLANVGPKTGQVVWYDDDAAGNTHYACNAPVNSVSGKVALITRGFGGAVCTATVPFTTKVKNAQDAGAIAVIVVNNVTGAPIVMGGGPDNTIIIPSVMISDVDGATIAAQLANNVNVTLSGTAAGTIQLDGDIDNGIIAHEFFHGVSGRLTGGPANPGCLGNTEQAGEGWSDYMALIITTNWATATVNDGVNVRRPIGNYAAGYPTSGPGIRAYPYNTSMAINPLTYSDLPAAVVPHGVGTVFCTALWEMTWEIIRTAGISPNIFNASGTGGNVIAFRLVMEGLKLQPCSPGFLDARNAILQADLNLYGGAHTCAIWTAFAKRGMGFGAVQGSSNNNNDQTVSFALPPACLTTAPNVTINQAAAQADPTSASPINFTVVFDQAVTGFATGDVTLSGTAGATTGTVTGSGTTYNVAVSGMTTGGTVIATIAAGVCQNASAQPNNASTSTDNTVTYIVTANPTVTINQAVTQADPTSVSPITFTVVFDQPVTGFTTGDVTLSGTAGATLATVTGSGANYSVAVTGMSANGTVIATIPAGVCVNAASQPNLASTSTDNTVTFSLVCVPPTVNTVPNQVVCAGAPTTAVNFTGTPGATYNWTNNTPAIGLAAAGTGNIPSFTALNPGATPLVATITVTPSTGGSSTTAPTPELFHYRFDGSGASVPNLASAPPAGTATATIVGANLSQAGTGQCNTALVSTGGTTSYVNTNWATVMNSAFTMSFWLGENQVDNNPSYLFGDVNAGAFRSFYGGAALTNNMLLRGGSGDILITGVNPAATLVTVVYNGTNTTVYKNGVFFQTYAVTFNNTGAGPFKIGGYGTGATTSLTGKLDEFRIYNRALTATEVATLTNCSAAATCTGAPTSFTITVNPNPAIVITADPGTTLCEGDPTLLTVVTGSSTPLGVLYTQGTAFVDGSPSQVFEAANAAFTSQAADDFVVPAGATWNITQLGVVGIGAGVPTSVNVFIYNNSALNLPGTAVATFNNVTTFTQAGANYTVTLPSTVTLTGGRYWVSFQVNMSFASGGQWFWGNYGAPVVGNPYAWQNPGGGFATPCTSWGYGGSGCNVGGGAANVNNIFTLTGTSVTSGGPLPGGYTFLWSPAAGLSSTTSNPVAASPMNTTTYTVVVTGPGGCSRTGTVTITVNKRPTITTQPTSRTNCEGSSATFTGAGTGTNLTYQWQVSTTGCAGPWVNLSNAAPYSGVNTAVLTVNPVTPAMSGYAYRLVLGGICAPVNNANISACAVLTVNANPVVTVTPASGCGGVAGINGLLLTASGANTYTWSPTAGLYTNPAATTAYTGGNSATVYAAPTAFTVYTVSGTATATGCVGTATAVINYTPPAPTVTPSSVAMCLGDPAVKLKSSSSTISTATFSSGTVSVAIPEGTFPTGPYTAGTNSIAVSGIPTNAVITKVSARLNITHAYVGDVVAVLQAPNGQRLNLDALLNATNNAGVNFVNTVISSTGTNLLSAGTAPFTNTYKADAVGASFLFLGTFTLPGGPVGYLPTTSSWTALTPTASDANGNWTIAMYDAGAPDVGTLTNWSIDIEYVLGVPSTPAVWTPIAGLYSDAAATIPYVAGTAVDSVWARPTPAGVYPYQVTVQSLPVAPVGFTNPATVSIPVGGVANPYPSNVTVGGLPTTGVTVRSVVLHGVSHTWSEDVDILLQSPSGQNVILMSDVGAGTVMTNSVFTFDDAGPAMNIAGANATGTYRPTNNGATDNFPAPGPGNVTQATPTLASFTGNMNGVWKLFAVDDDGIGDQGSIASGYTINFGLTAAPCTSPARTVIVTVNQPTTITTQPVNQTICTDKVATFSVVAAGSGPFSYQWQVSTNNGNAPWTNITNGGVYSGATTATLTITAPPVSMSGYQYRVIVTGAAPCAAATSLSRILTVNPLPTIVISAAPYTALFPGLVTTLSSVVTPNAVQSYTWLRNGATVPGGTNASLSVNVDGLGDYTLRVTDVNGCTNTSNTLTIRDSASAKCFIYPNPTSGRFQVRYYSVANNVLPRTLTVYDSKGDRVFTQNYTIGRPYDRMDVDMRAYGKGLYWVEIGDVNGNRLSMCRVVLQ